MNPFRYPMTSAWLAANERGDLSVKIHINKMVDQIATGFLIHGSTMGRIIREWSANYVWDS